MATEKRLIDANALKETVTTDYYEHFTRYHDTDQIALIDMVCDDIEEAPTVDAVEVVRCKDCIDHDRCEVEDLLVKLLRIENAYCAAGERKDNG